MPDTAAQRLGVLGGTFDPPHLGHLAIAREADRRLGLDAVLFVVANDPWQKTSCQAVTPATVRLKMTEAALRGFSRFHACTSEIDRGGQSYMADTLAELNAARPGSDLFLIVGSDAAAGLNTWKRPREVKASATAVVVVRCGWEDSRPPAGWPHIVVEGSIRDVSSAEIRSRCAAGRPVDAMVPADVAAIIEARGLYGASGGGR